MLLLTRALAPTGSAAAHHWLARLRPRAQPINGMHPAGVRLAHAGRLL